MASDDIKQLNEFLAAHPEVDLFEVILPDLNGHLRGKWLPRAKIESAFSGGLKLPVTTLGFDVWGRDVESWVFENGDADGICRADIRTLCTVPWLEHPTGQVLLSMEDLDGTPSAFDPRSVVQQLMSRFAEKGLRPVFASEMEFYLLQMGQDQDGRPLHSQMSSNGNVATGGQTYSIDLMQDMSVFMHGVLEAGKQQGLPIDTLIAEAAPSQYEINLYHQPDALLAADQSLMLQRAIKGVARNLGMRATFMAKPFGDLAGNGMHMHCSLIDDQGNNQFDDGSTEGSELLRQAIAGCLATMQDCMLLFAPHLNSYRRFQRGSHAPMAPTWGYDNRTVSVRVPADSPKAMRIEHRVAGADANPYLVMAAIMAGMLYGLDRQLDAPAPIEGDAYSQTEVGLPRYWPQALDVFRHSQFIRDYFGEAFQRVFSEAKQQEMDEFDRQVTPLEYEAYL